MATKDTDFLGSIRGSAGEAKDRLKNDAAERKAEGSRKGSIILNQKDVLTGEWDASKILFTTISGQARLISADDLSAFRRNIATAQSKIKKGITAKQVIDWSNRHVDGVKFTDLDLANKQITMAVPVGASNGTVRYITNAGPDSDVLRHHVIVEFLNYSAEAASGLTDPRKSALRLRRGHLKIECDCGKWRYWYRYIATIGGYNAGRRETGYPKIRNPKIQGIACKHIVRVMADIQMGRGATVGYLTRLMDKAKSSDEANALLRQKQADAEKIIKGQSRRTTGNIIKTSEQKRQERSRKNAEKALGKISKITKTGKKSRQINRKSSQDAREAALRATMAGFGIEPTQEQINKVRNSVK